MKIKNSALKLWFRRSTGLMTALVMALSFSGQASARILFEDDQFFNINSEGVILDYNNDVGSANEDVDLQFGNDGTDATISYNGQTGDITLSTPGGDFSFSDDNLSTTGRIFFQNTTEFHLREDSDPNTNAACSSLDELIIDTTDNELQICTAVGTPGTWAAIGAGTLDGLDSTQFLRSDTNDNYTSGTLTFDAGTILDINGDVDFSGATSFLLYQGNSNPATCTEGEMFYNTTSNSVYVCTATDTWTEQTAGTQDFEAVYAADGDNTLTATGTFDIDVTGAIGIDSDAGVSIGGAGLGLTSDSGTDISITAADDIIFDDAQLTGVVQLSDTATDWDATFSSDGIVDNINAFSSTANGEGASNVGIEDASAWFTGTEIEAALDEIETLFGSTTSSTFDFTENNVLTDDDPVYTALNRLDLKWGDLASIANGEGASLVGIEDAGGNFTATTVEGALSELAGNMSGNYEDLTFYPEYPDTVVNADGSNNRGILESLYDGTEESGYYNWSTHRSTTQDIDLHFAFPLPTDFSSTGDFTFRYRTGTTTEADNDVEIRLYNVTDSQECANDLSNGSAGTWATGTITAASINTGCTGGSALDAGDIVEVQVKLYDNSGSTDYADVGHVVWNYTK